jgi:hypothetical protein
MISQRLTPPHRVLSAALLTLSLASTAFAAPSSAAHRAPGKTNAIHVWRPGWLPGDPPTSLASGLFIAIDPVTHRPTAPSAEQKRAWAAQQELDALLAPTRPLQVERLPGGGNIIHLNGQFQTYSIARRDAKGHIVTDCATDPASARKLLKQPVPPPKTAWEEK